MYNRGRLSWRSDPGAFVTRDSMHRPQILSSRLHNLCYLSYETCSLYINLIMHIDGQIIITLHRQRHTKSSEQIDYISNYLNLN